MTLLRESAFCERCGRGFERRKIGKRARFCPPCQDAHKREHDHERYLIRAAARDRLRPVKERPPAKIEAARQKLEHAIANLPKWKCRCGASYHAQVDRGCCPECACKSMPEAGMTIEHPLVMARRYAEGS